jgi:glucarate dehydratase
MSFRRVLCLFAVLIVTAGSVYGQAISGNITGTVVDPAGASVPGAEVQIKNVATGARDDAMAMQFLVPDWKYDPKKPSLGRPA